MTLKKEDFILLGLRGKDHFSPVQVQKLFFLLDKNISHSIGGPFFDFKPYNYGPFDKSVYLELGQLSQQGLVNIQETNGTPPRYYQLTELGQKRAEQLANKNTSYLEYISAVSSFVRSLSFSDLVASIYKAYPEMKANSVFSE